MLGIRDIRACQCGKWGFIVENTINELFLDAFFPALGYSLVGQAKAADQVVAEVEGTLEVIAGVALSTAVVVMGEDIDCKAVLTC